MRTAPQILTAHTWRMTRTELEGKLAAAARDMDSAATAGDWGLANQLKIIKDNYQGMIDRREYMGGEGDTPMGRPRNKAVFMPR